MISPNPVVAPSGWAAVFAADISADRRMACLALVDRGDHLRLYLPRAMAPRIVARRMQFRANGQEVAVLARHRLPGGMEMQLARPDGFTGALTMQLGDDAQTVQAVTGAVTGAGSLAGKNVLLALYDGEDLSQIADWARYHARFHGATGLCLIARMPLDAGAMANALAGTGIGAAVIWHVTLPTGSADQPSRHSAVFAPDAPNAVQRRAGKTLPHDSHTAPLDEISLLEIMRRTLLQTARAVVFCEIADLIIGPPDQQVFEAVCTLAPGEYLRFFGTNLYPVAQSGAVICHADHSAIVFDGRAAAAIWAVAGAQTEGVWRPAKIGGLQPAVTHAQFGFYRCMGVLHPQMPLADLADPTHLIAQGSAADSMEQAFGLRPAVPVIQAGTVVAPAPAKTRQVLVVTTMRNEAPFILEWLAWHRSIGVTDFLIYTNDCDDGTDTLLDKLAAKGVVEHRRNPYRERGGKPQAAALKDADISGRTGAADWVICMDVDEFITIHVGDGTLDALFAACPDATMWALTWRLFGSGGITGFEDKPVTAQFTQAAPHLVRAPHQAWGFKTLFRPLGHFAKTGVHRPKGLDPAQIGAVHWVNGAGQRLPDTMLQTGWRSNLKTVGYDLVSLHHYCVRSAESFLVKRQRGRVNHVARDQGLAYWFRMNNNAQTSMDAQSHQARMTPFLTELLADPDIVAAHGAGVAAHRAKIETLKQDEDYAALFAQITSARLHKLSHMLHLFDTPTFDQGPDVIPAGFEARTDLPPPPQGLPGQMVRERLAVMPVGRKRRDDVTGSE